MSYTPKQQGSTPGGSSNQPSQQAKTLAQQLQNFTHGQNALSQGVSLPGAGLGAVNFANLNITLQQQQQQQRFDTMMKQQIQHMQQQQQNVATEPLALTRGPADMLNKTLQHHQQQQANGNTGAASLVNQQLQIQALASNHSVVMQQMQMQIQAIQFQMQQHNQQKMMPSNQAQQTLSPAAAAQQHLQHLVQQKMLVSQNKTLSTPKQHKATLPTAHQSLPQHSQQPIQSNNNLPSKSPAKLPATLSSSSKQSNSPQSTVKSTQNYATPKTPTSASSTPKQPSATAQINAKPTPVLPKTPPTAAPLPKSPSASSLTISRTTVPSQSPPKSVSLPPQIPLTQSPVTPTPAKEITPKPGASKDVPKDQAQAPVPSITKPSSPESKQTNITPLAPAVSGNVPDDSPKEPSVEKEQTKPDEKSSSNETSKVEEEVSKETETTEETVTTPVEPTPDAIPSETTAPTEEKKEATPPVITPKPTTPSTPVAKPITKPAIKTKPGARKPTTPRTEPIITTATTTTTDSTPVLSSQPESQVEKKKSSPTKESKEIVATPEKSAKPEVVETPKSTDGRRSRRHRLKTILYQSPLPELAFITKLSVSEASYSPKSVEDKLTLFYKNEYLAVRNAEAGFFLCQTMQNVFRSSPKIRIRWLSEEKKGENVYIPDFYDTTDLECVLTTVEMEKVGKNRLKIPKAERDRIDNILKKALDVERGVAPRPDVTEENPDGLDISLYKNESQIEKKIGKTRKLESSPKRVASKSPKKKKKTKYLKKEQRKRTIRDSNESNESEDETDNDKEYKPSRKRALLTPPKMRAQRSPLAKARAASPITIKNDNTLKTKSTVPLKSSASGKKGNLQDSSSSISSRTDRAKRRATEILDTEAEDIPVKKAALSNSPKKTPIKTPAKVTKAMSSDDELLIPLVKKSTPATKSATKNVTNNSSASTKKIKSTSSDKLVPLATTVTITPTIGNRPTRNRK